MKRLITILILLLLFVTACSNNPDQNNYDNSSDENQMEDIYEDNGGDPDLEAESYTIILPENTSSSVNDYNAEGFSV